MRYALLLLAACAGRDDDSKPATTAPEPGVCTPSAAPSAPLRLLSRTDVDNTLSDLLAVEGSVRTRLPADPVVHGFEGFADTVGVSQLQADGYLRASEDATAQIDWDELLSCSIATGDKPCAEALIDGFGARAFRRPLLPDERAIFVDLFDEMNAAAGFQEGVASVVQAVLQSPQFLYKLEIGEAGPAGSAVPLTPHELATRLSYLFWASTPDSSLMAAADDGTLTDSAVLSAQIDRLLADPRAKGVVGRFVEQWTGIGGLNSVPKDALAFPSWSPALAADLREETRRFAADVVFEGEGTLTALLTADYTVANSTVAAHYGLTGPTSVEEWVQLDLPADQRSGLLTQASLLATAAHSNQSSPVHRGLFVYEQLFCGVQQQPPDDLNITLPALDASISTRERFARHTQDPLCAGCHSFMDPIGFGFEHYDPVGAWRDTEGAGVPVESSGVLTYSSQQGPFDGAVQLGQLAADAPEVRACFVTQWFRSTWGRDPQDADICTTDELTTAFADGDVLALLRSIPHTETFQKRAAVTP